MAKISPQIRAARVAYRGIFLAVRTTMPDHAPRPLAVYLLVTLCNVPGTVAGRVAGISKQAVSKDLRDIEARRDETDYDLTLAVLENLLTEPA